MGVALLPRVAVAREIAMGTMAPIAIADAPTIHRPVVAIHRRGPGLSGPAEAFLAMLREQRQDPASPAD
jgi:DNA-binding transcriptional LysR family regulator